MYIYRVEHRTNGVGPYQSSFWSEGGSSDLLRMANAHRGHHHPSAFYMLGFSSRHYCGFYSIENLKSWFDSFLEILHKHSYVVRSYRVKKQFAITDGIQVAFIRDEAMCLKTRDIVKI